MESHPAVCGSSAVNGVYAASLYFGCDNVRADCDGGVSSDPGGARTAAEFDRKRNLMLSDIAHDFRNTGHDRIRLRKSISGSYGTGTGKTAGISERHPE